MFYKSVARFNKERPNAHKQLTKNRLIVWRKQNSITRIERPTKLDRARRLGYRPIQGLTVVRVKISRGGRRLSPPTKGRRSKRSGVNRITPNQSRQVIAEKRVSRRFPNMELLNSYHVGEDGKYLYYEAIMVDPNHPRVKSDKKLNWLSPDPTKAEKHRNSSRHKGRAFRGLTSAGRKSRGLRNKGTGAEQFR